MSKNYDALRVVLPETQWVPPAAPEYDSPASNWQVARARVAKANARKDAEAYWLRETEVAAIQRRNRAIAERESRFGHSLVTALLLIAGGILFIPLTILVALLFLVDCVRDPSF